MQTEKIRLKLYLTVFTALLLLGVLGFMFIENLSLVDAIYFSIVTMTTVGYGDIHPQSAVGKILALLIIVGGVGTFLGLIASITDIFVKRREEFYRQQKLNRITGLFFSEMGNGLLRRFAQLDPEIGTLHQMLRVTNQWTNEDFHKVNKSLKRHVFVVESRSRDLLTLKEYLQNHAGLLLRLIENPIVQEHENFTDLLHAIFHLRDELLNRKDLFELPELDQRHIDEDIVRVYKLLVSEWLWYMHYLKNNYGYLFSLAIRVNPFDPNASVVVTGS